MTSALRQLQADLAAQQSSNGTSSSSQAAAPTTSAEAALQGRNGAVHGTQQQQQQQESMSASLADAERRLSHRSATTSADAHWNGDSERSAHQQSIPSSVKAYLTKQLEPGSSLADKQQAIAQQKAGSGTAHTGGTSAVEQSQASEQQTGHGFKQVAGAPANDAVGLVIGTSSKQEEQIDSKMHFDGMSEETTWELMIALSKGEALRAPLHNELKMDLQYKVKGCWHA